MDKQSSYEYEKYVTNSDNVLDTLNKYGVAIIPDILNQLECDTIKQGMWVNAYNTNEGDATLIILEGSHKYHGDFAKEFDETSPDD